jgi:hypothetical protein
MSYRAAGAESHREARERARICAIPTQTIHDPNLTTTRKL